MSTPIDLNDLATAIGQLVLRFRLQRNTAAAWTASNEVLLSAELGYETDTNKLKIGDGTTAWNSLAYWTPFPEGVESVVAGDGIGVDDSDPLNPIVHAAIVSLIPGSNVTIINDGAGNYIISATGGGGGGGSSNVTPDTHPSTPTASDDEFEYGTAIDTTGARFSGATGWTVITTSGATAPIVGDGYIYGNTVAVAGSVIMSIPFPSSGDCTFVMKAKRPTIASYTGWRLHVLNSANGNMFSAQTFSSYSILTETDTYNLTTGVITGVANPYLDNSIFPYPSGVAPWMWFRLRIVGTNIFPGWSDTGHPDDYVEGTVMPFATFLGVRPTHVGINMPMGNHGVCDYFRRVV